MKTRTGETRTVANAVAGGLDLPWRVEFVSDDCWSWVIFDHWGIAIARFNREEVADAVVMTMNRGMG